MARQPIGVIPYHSVASDFCTKLATELPKTPVRLCSCIKRQQIKPTLPVSTTLVAFMRTAMESQRIQIKRQSSFKWPQPKVTSLHKQALAGATRTAQEYRTI